MQTNLVQQFANTSEGQEAEEILRACVHCGFCTATCPTYQELNDERDGPRGRIYLMKMFLEGGEVTEKTREHLDRCLTCRSCEDRKSTRLNSSHVRSSYAVACLKKERQRRAGPTAAGVRR